MSRIDGIGLAIREDARFAVKSLARVKTYTATVTLTLALAIGGVTAVFSVLYAAVLRPLPFPNSEELVNVYGHFFTVNLPRVPSSPNEFIDIRDKNRSFSKVAGYVSANINLTGHGEAVRIAGGFVTSEFFRTLGVPPVMGRDFAPGEDGLGAPDVAILGAAFHRRLYGGSPDAVGKVIELDGRPHTIIGVASPVLDRERRIGDLKDDGGEPRDVWVPLSFTPQQLEPHARGGRYIAVIGRCKPGVSEEGARADMRGLGLSFYDAFPAEYQRAAGWGMNVAPLKGAGNMRAALTLELLLGAVGLVLLAACANVVSLTLARLASRKREIAVRVALGATASRIAVQFLVESVLLAIGGGALGLVFGRVAVDGLLAFASGASPVGRLEVSLDGSILAFAAAMSVATGLIAGAAPAWHAARLSPTVGLREGGRSTSASALRLRSALVVAQVAVALVLLVGTGMLLRSLVTMTTTSPGFDTKDTYVGFATLAEPRYTKEADQLHFATAALQNVQAIPGVESAGLTSLLPLDGWSDWSFLVEGEPEPEVRNVTQMRSIAGDYFKALGIRLVAGRTFTDSDTADAPHVGIVNETLVAKYLHGQNPIGKRFLFHLRPGDKEWHPFTIVGIVGDTRDMGIDEPVHAFFYAPFAQDPHGSTGFVVRAPRLGAAVLPAMRAAVASVDPTQPLFELGPLQNFVDRSLGSRKFILLLLGVFAGLGLALAVLGIYGVTSYSVVQRTQEIAVRMAMGADDVAIVRLVLAQALRLVGIGLFFGAICAALLGHYLASLIYGLSPWDPQAVSIISALLITAALVAGWVPARRAAALPLANALRTE